MKLVLQIAAGILLAIVVVAALLMWADIRYQNKIAAAREEAIEQIVIDCDEPVSTPLGYRLKAEQCS